MYWLLYDISDNRRRNKLARLCLDCGLRRVQKSCFYGSVDRVRVKQLQQSLNQLLLPEDHVCLIPVSQKTVSSTMIWGHENDRQPDLDMICFV